MTPCDTASDVGERRGPEGGREKRGGRREISGRTRGRAGYGHRRHESHDTADVPTRSSHGPPFNHELQALARVFMLSTR